MANAIRARARENRLHLFSAKMTEAASIERRSVLADWRFPIRIDGVVVLFDRSEEDDRAHRLFRAFKPAADRTLVWVKAQELPFVVAAMGHEGGGLSARALHEQLALSSGVPILLGPSPSRVPPPTADLPRPRGDAERGVMSLLRGSGHVRFDHTFAEQVLDLLCNEIKTRRQTGEGRCAERVPNR